MGNKQVRVQKRTQVKENQIVKLLVLRKLIRNSQNFSQCRLFARFGIGIIKYEVNSNFIGVPLFKKISSFDQFSCIKRTFVIESKNFVEKNLNIQKIDLNQSQIEQLYQETMLISGGFNAQQKRFTICSSDTISQEFQMQNLRFWHRTSFNKRNTIYIISGRRKNSNSTKLNVKECEVFKLNSLSFQIISQIEDPVYLFGCDQTQLLVHIFGGFSYTCYSKLQKIQVYDQKLNL